LLLQYPFNWAVAAAHAYRNGVDFSPPYLRIAALREEFAGCAVIGLTRLAPLKCKAIAEWLVPARSYFPAHLNEKNLSSCFTVASKIQ